MPARQVEVSDPGLLLEIGLEVKDSETDLGLVGDLVQRDELVGLIDEVAEEIEVVRLTPVVTPGAAQGVGVDSEDKFKVKWKSYGFCPGKC